MKRRRRRKSSHLESERIHDDVVGHDADWMHFTHQHRGGNFVELDALEEVGHDVAQINGATRGVAGALRPVQRRLEFGQLVRLQLLARQNQPHHMLGQQRERAQ